MNTLEAKLLSNYDLDAVSGGKMNDGKQQLINKDQRGDPGSGRERDDGHTVFDSGITLIGIVALTAVSF